MWVRSQNKRFLGCYDSFAVSESGLVIGYQGPEDGEGATLGNYENIENALLVLNEMQGYIVYGNRNVISPAVFEMPLNEGIEC